MGGRSRRQGSSPAPLAPPGSCPRCPRSGTVSVPQPRHSARVPTTLGSVWGVMQGWGRGSWWRLAGEKGKPNLRGESCLSVSLPAMLGKTLRASTVSHSHCVSYSSRGEFCVPGCSGLSSLQQPVLPACVRVHPGGGVCGTLLGRLLSGSFLLAGAAGGAGLLGGPVIPNLPERAMA